MKNKIEQSVQVRIFSMQQVCDRAIEWLCGFIILNFKRQRRQKHELNFVVFNRINPGS